YLADTGLLCYLLGIETVEEFLRSPLLGAIWEAFVFSELRKRETFANGKWEIWYWRDLRKLEVDFLIHKGGRFFLMEAKFTETPTARDTQELKKVEEILGRKNIEQKSILCRTPHRYTLSNGTEIAPLWK
ncbi:MAG: DUF4143 domain-containing protein, partial [Deltaproteobacteria bacterium]|nr:DUF4143 domain-containing protein [Deltaproteobacteria bacterium]